MRAFLASFTRMWVFAIIFFGVALLVRTFVIEIGIVDGRSMEPTYRDSEAFVVYKLPLLFHAPKRGEVVQVDYRPEHTMLVKRIIGLPGELVTVRLNKVFITHVDGTQEELSEHYLAPDTRTLAFGGFPTTFGPFGADEYFVLGDHRERSAADSRLLGAIPREWIVGNAGPPLRLPGAH